MDTITFRNSTQQITRMGLGCMGMSACYGATNDNESIATIRRAYDLGVNHFDTADCYGIAGHNELLLARAFKNIARDKIVLASKCGFEPNPATPSGYVINNDPKYIKQCCENSLKRLNTDYLDLFYLHRINPATPLEVSMQAVADLVAEGKILHVGLSEVGAKTIVAANACYPIAAVQSEYSLTSRDWEQDVITLCQSLGIIFVAFSPTGRGLFSGKIRELNILAADDGRRSFPRFSEENFSKNLFVVDILTKIANNRGCTSVQVALAWVLAQFNNVVAIPGTRCINHLEENLKAQKIVLSQQELEELNNLCALNCAYGKRVPQEYEQFIVQ